MKATKISVLYSTIHIYYFDIDSLNISFVLIVVFLFTLSEKIKIFVLCGGKTKNLLVAMSAQVYTFRHFPGTSILSQKCVKMKELVVLYRVKIPNPEPRWGLGNQPRHLKVCKIETQLPTLPHSGGDSRISNLSPAEFHIVVCLPHSYLITKKIKIFQKYSL